MELVQELEPEVAQQAHRNKDLVLLQVYGPGSGPGGGGGDLVLVPETGKLANCSHVSL